MEVKYVACVCVCVLVAHCRNHLIREMRLIDSFGCHPHLLRHYQAWQESGHSFIQTEYCARGDLESFLQKQADAGRQVRAVWRVWQSRRLVLRLKG